ncbi:MAG: SH3 domain-containing protein [Candidatus Rokubacteria bacterium]|nr:SH3 domain-containing protein [Candidatus Rokubacteria bacterium]
MSGMGRFWRTSVLVIGAVGLVGLAAADSATFVRVSAETANVREGPSLRHERLWEAYENDPLKVVTRSGRWLKVVDFEGYAGWIYAPLTDNQPAVIVTKGLVNVRSGPGTQHPVAFTARRGVAFRVLKEAGDWLKVEHADGDQGWIYRPLVWGSP